MRSIQAHAIALFISFFTKMDIYNTLDSCTEGLFPFSFLEQSHIILYCVCCVQSFVCTTRNRLNVEEQTGCFKLVFFVIFGNGLSRRRCLYVIHQTVLFLGFFGFMVNAIRLRIHNFNYFISTKISIMKCSLRI